MSKEEIRVVAPGRICLFGEHQDYLRLPVIAAAISLYIEITAVKTTAPKLIIDLLDLNKQETIELTNREVSYLYDRDYLRSAYNQFIRMGYRLRQGYICKLHGTIPINAGLSSSSAMIIAWITFLSYVFKANLSPYQIGEFGYQAEVDEFREAGGMMDHFTSALGGLLYINTKMLYDCKVLDAKLKGIVIGDSLERKNTIADLARVKEQVQIGISQIRKMFPTFDLKKTPYQDVEQLFPSMTSNVAKKLQANIINRNLTKQARTLLSSPNFSPNALGVLLNAHHEQLARNLEISTPKIDKLVDVARKAGALGAKINGSGFGGCMFAYAPDEPEKVAKAIEEAGGKAYIVSVSEGCKIIPS
jgi:galactokinase